MALFTKHSKPVLNFRLLLLPKVKLVNFYFEFLSSFPFVSSGESWPSFWPLHPWESELEKMPSVFWGTLFFRGLIFLLSHPWYAGLVDTPAGPAHFCDICIPRMSLISCSWQAGVSPSTRLFPYKRSARTVFRAFIYPTAKSALRISPPILDVSHFQGTSSRLPYIFFWRLLNPHSQIKEPPNHRTIHFIRSLSRILGIYAHVYVYTYWALPTRAQATLRTQAFGP